MHDEVQVTNYELQITKLSTEAPGIMIGGSQLPRPLRPNLFNLDEVDALALVHTRAHLMGHVPVILRPEVLNPKRPSTALQRTDRMNSTGGFVSLSFQEDAITIRPFRQAVMQPDTPQVFLLEPAIRTPEKL